MDVRFSLQESDLIALARYRLDHSPARVKRYRMGWLGLSLLFFTAAVALHVNDLRAPAYYIGAFAAFFLVFYPYYYRWLVGRTLRRLISASRNPEAFAGRRLKADRDGLSLDGGGKRADIAWHRVTGVSVTPDRAYVAVDGEYAVVLPKAALGAERFQELVDVIRTSSGRTV